MKLNRSAKLSVLVFACICWAIYTMRPEALFLASLLVLSLTSKKIRSSNQAVLLTVAIIFLAPFSPIGITLRSTTDGPKLVECCPNRFVSPDQNEVAKEAAKRSDCYLCSDVVTGFEPRKYLVW